MNHKQMQSIEREIVLQRIEVIIQIINSLYIAERFEHNTDVLSDINNAIEDYTDMLKSYTIILEAMENGLLCLSSTN